MEGPMPDYVQAFLSPEFRKAWNDMKVLARKDQKARGVYVGNVRPAAKRRTKAARGSEASAESSQRPTGTSAEGGSPTQ